MAERINYDKLPWWARQRWIKRDLGCKVGLHVPVKNGATGEVFCQECFKAMTHQEWVDFFRKAKA